MKIIYVIIPAYNEQAKIADVVKSVPKQIKVDGKLYETKVVVVDDHSKDQTDKIAKSAGAKVLKHVINSGAGAATRTGLKYVQRFGVDAEYAVTIDADGQHSVGDIEKMIKFAAKNNAKMVVGNRLHAGNKDNMPAHRTFGNIGLSLFSRLLFGIKTADTQSGLRLFHVSVLPAVSDYVIDRYGFCTEMLWLASRSGVEVKEVPISVAYSADTLRKGQSSWGGVDLIKDLIWLRVSR